MITTEQRTAILELAAKEVSRREISRVLKISRGSIRKVLRLGSKETARLERPEKATDHRQEILDLHRSCQGNLVRVHEELQAQGVAISYQALTAFCRRQEIGTTPKIPSGRYEFDPGQEIQHDTSPHQVLLGGKKRKVQTASAVLCHSRMLFFQCSPTFQRFDCKAFLAKALEYFDGVPRTVMIDNTHVVVLRGTGADMIPVPEMAAFAERYGFEFRAHAVGHANRSARVERPFWFIETNFLAGRTFTDWNDLNARAREWCDKVNGSHKRHLRAVPKELWIAERNALRPLPLWRPEPYRIHQRIVDIEGFVCLNTNRYSVPDAWIGRRVEARETVQAVEITLDRAGTTRHERIVDPLGRRITLPEHKRARTHRPRTPDVSPERRAIEREAPEIVSFLAELETRGKKTPGLARRQLLRLVRDYPRGPLVAAIEEASRYGLFDLERIERMILRRIAQDYFLLAPAAGEGNNDGDNNDR